VEGQPVGPGYYSLFTIPNPETWTVILNRDTTLYGSSFYNADKDIARFTVMSNTTERYYETLTIDIDLIPNNARMYISWVNTQVAFDILTSTDEEMMRYIQDEVISGKSRDPNIYAGAAEYMLYQGINLHEAVRLADKALQLDKNSWAGNVKLKLYETMGYYEEAIQMVKQGLDVTRKGKYEREKDQLERIAELEAILNRLEKKQRQ
jgi:tetratricopeptide (TPR) repeat protein